MDELLKKSSRVPKLIEVIKHILVLLLDPDSQPEQLSSNVDNACVEGMFNMLVIVMLGIRVY